VTWAEWRAANRDRPIAQVWRDWKHGVGPHALRSMRLVASELLMGPPTKTDEAMITGWSWRIGLERLR